MYVSNNNNNTYIINNGIFQSVQGVLRWDLREERKGAFCTGWGSLCQPSGHGHSLTEMIGWQIVVLKEDRRSLSGPG